MNEKTRFMLALITPAALVLILFQVVPILTGADASFRNLTLHDPKRTWVGFANYLHVLRDAEFRDIVLPNTFVFMITIVACSLVLGLAIALILLAGLQGLPPEPFEAARIDAASAWRTFRYITLPMLRPVIVVCIVIRAIDAFRTFDIVWTISGGGPARATELFSIYAYVESFQFLNLGRGSAAAVIGAIIIVVFAMILYRVLNRFVEVSR